MERLSFFGKARDYFVKLLQEGVLSTQNLIDKTSMDFFPLPDDIFMSGIFVNNENLLFVYS